MRLFWKWLKSLIFGVSPTKTRCTLSLIIAARHIHITLIIDWGTLRQSTARHPEYKTDNPPVFNIPRKACLKPHNIAISWNLKVHSSFFLVFQSCNCKSTSISMWILVATYYQLLRYKAPICILCFTHSLGV